MSIPTISALAYEYDPLPGIWLEHPGDGSEIEAIQRRVERTKTLDGGVAVVDGGFADGDRTIRLEVDTPTADQFAAAKRYVNLYQQIRVCTADGSFLCRGESLRGDMVAFVLVLLVESKLSA